MNTKVKLSARDIYEFSMHNSYYNISGFIGVMISLVALVGAVFSIGRTSIVNTVLLFIVAAMFTVIQPLMIKLKSNKQAKMNQSIGAFLEYTFDDEGFTISDGANEDRVMWELILKLESTKNLALLYTTMMRAFVIPKDSLASKYPEFRDMINTKARNARGKLK